MVDLAQYIILGRVHTSDKPKWICLTWHGALRTNNLILNDIEFRILSYLHSVKDAEVKYYICTVIEQYMVGLSTLQTNCNYNFTVVSTRVKEIEIMLFLLKIILV